MQLWSLRHFLLTALYSKSPKNAKFIKKIYRFSAVWIVVKRVGRWNKNFTAYHILILQFECHQMPFNNSQIWTETCLQPVFYIMSQGKLLSSSSMLIWVPDEKNIYFSFSVVPMLWNKISPSFIEKQGKCILTAQRIGKFEYWIFTQPNKNIFSLIFLCEGTERNFYFKRKFKICCLCHSSSRFNILQFKSRVLQIKIINHLSPDWIYILCRILFQNESLSSKDKM